MMRVSLIMIIYRARLKYNNNKLKRKIEAPTREMINNFFIIMKKRKPTLETKTK
jgi:hypothetical protein